MYFRTDSEEEIFAEMEMEHKGECIAVVSNDRRLAMADLLFLMMKRMIPQAPALVRAKGARWFTRGTGTMFLGYRHCARTD